MGSATFSYGNNNNNNYNNNNINGKRKSFFLCTSSLQWLLARMVLSTRYISLLEKGLYTAGAAAPNLLTLSLLTVPSPKLIDFPILQTGKK